MDNAADKAAELAAAGAASSVWRERDMAIS
jgi:hypothetical protein